jgi:hypothetical protein
MNRGRRELGDAPNEDSACLAFQQNRPRRADGNVRKGRIDVVGVDKLDRLGRSFQRGSIDLGI